MAKKKISTIQEWVTKNLGVEYDSLDKKYIEFLKTHSRAELKEYYELEETMKLLSGMSEDEAKEHIEKNIYRRALKKSFIAAYVKTYHSEEDNKWLSKCMRAKQTRRVLTDKKGNVIYNTKTGKPKTVMVKSDEETKSFDKEAATKAFEKEYDITFKATGFEARAKRETAKYDVFKGLM